MKKLSFLITFALVMLLPFVAFAGGAAASPSDDVGNALNKLLVGTLIGGLTMLGKRLWSWLGHKTATAKLIRYAESHGLIQDFAQQALDYANELAHQSIKAGRTLAGDLKESAAVERGLELLDDVGFTAADRKKAADDLRKIILARLGATRSPGPVGGATLRTVPRGG